MIDYTSIRRDLEVFLSDNLTVTIQFENTIVDLTLVKEFITLTIQESTSSSLGMGEEQFQVEGDVIVQIFTSLGSGTQRSREIATDVSNLLSNRTLASISFETPSLHSIGQVEDSDLYQQNLLVPFNYFFAGNENTC